MDLTNISDAAIGQQTNEDSFERQPQQISHQLNDDVQLKARKIMNEFETNPALTPLEQRRDERRKQELPGLWGIDSAKDQVRAGEVDETQERFLEQTEMIE